MKLCAQDIMDLKNNAMQHLHQLNPSELVPNYNPHPQEEILNSGQRVDDENLKSSGVLRLKEENDAAFVYENQQKRLKITENSADQALQRSNALIEGAEDQIYQNCHWEPGPCDEKKTIQHCLEKSNYESFSCLRKLVVEDAVHDIVEVKRFVLTGSEYSLTSCSKNDLRCNANTLITLDPRCERIVLEVFFNGKLMELEKQPTCLDPSFKLARKKELPYLIGVFKVKEFWSEDRWEEGACDFKEKYFCFPETEEICIEGEGRRDVHGFSIHRSCWAKERRFSCATGILSNCSAIQAQGCANIDVQCLAQRNSEHCDELERSYQCIEKKCKPDRKVCVDALYCADGSCDHTNSEISDDLNEGISRLGAVAGVGEEVANKQTGMNSVEVFKGGPLACSEFALGVRDCCVGDGFLEGVFRCPDSLRELQRAKLEGRASLIGKYKEDLGLKDIYVYCVFPTKLSGIIQIQGRLQQLGISFGSPKYPKCDTGFTANLLEKINFKALDLSSMVKDFRDRTQFIELNSFEASTQNHVTKLLEQKRAYD